MKLPLRRCVFGFKRKFLGGFLAILFCFLIILGLGKIFNVWDRALPVDFILTKVKTTTLSTPIRLSSERMKQVVENKRRSRLGEKKNNVAEAKLKWLREKAERSNGRMPERDIRLGLNLNGSVSVDYNVHVFYYAWYENESIDGGWQHWNHEYLKNWQKSDRKVYPTGRHRPPDDIGSNFYPKLGCYSSRDPKVIEEHMKQIKNAGIGVLIVSWYPPGMSDGTSRSSDTVFLQLLNAAEKHQLKISPHIEPYQDRNPSNFLKYLKYFTSTYGNHPALYKMKRKGRDLTVYYIYDSYRTPAFAWKELMAPNGNMSLRGTAEDGIFLGLLVDADHKQEIKRARFDGFYTYFATNGFTYGSTWKNWKTLSGLARHQDLIFVPSIGPGYVDTRIRPWNWANTRHRRHGKYYEVAWRAAINSAPGQISITSFNEWHEGTQIEPAVAKTIDDYNYLDYEPEGSDFYLNLTRFWIDAFSKKNFPLPIS